MDPRVERNERMLREWSQYKNIWGRFGDPDDPNTDKIARAVGSYIIRMLSRGIVPDCTLVKETIEGKRPIPYCGNLGCTFITAEDHKDWVH